MSFNLPNAHVYYVVKHDVYYKCRIKREEIDEQLALHPKKVVKKVKDVHTLLAASGIKWNIIGQVMTFLEELSPFWNVLEQSVYAVKGEGEAPVEFKKFVRILVRLDAPLSLFCTKTQKLIIKTKKEIKKEKEDEAKNKDKPQEASEEEDS